MTARLEFLDRDPRVLLKQENIPILVPHDSGLVGATEDAE